jgi:glycosyltransferase involved in cell wall biosynthesis
LKPNILFLLHLPPPVHGSSVIGEYIQKSLVINQTFNAKYINLLISNEVSSSGKISWRKVCIVLIIWYQLLIELILRKPNLCYLALTTTGFAFYRDVFLVVLLKIFRVKRIYHLHNKGVSRWSKFWVHRYFYRFVFKNADIILLSKFLYPDIQEFVPINNVHICPNGIPNKNIDKKSKETGNSYDVPKILFLSNLIESKGVFVLLEACSILKQKGILFHCDFVGGEGDVSVSQFNEQVQKYGIADEVEYLGKKYGIEKEIIFSEADIFVFPTYYPNECFPLVVLEAMQFELPVISTTEGGIRDMVDEGKTGFLLDKKDPNLLAELIIQLIDNNELRRKMGKVGREKYMREFTIDKFERKMVEILDNSLNVK